jgi:hypothetical protein
MYQLDPSVYRMIDSSSTVTIKEMLADYVHTLEEYHALFPDDTQNAFPLPIDDMLVDESTGSEYYFEKDDSYEADLHVAIGTLYAELATSTTTGERSITDATSHFQQAIRLYEMSGERQSANMALAKYNLSILHFQNGDFRMASNRYSDALDIFRSIQDINGDGLHVDDMELLASRLAQQQKNLQFSGHHHQPHRTSKSQTTRTTKVTVARKTNEATSVKQQGAITNWKEGASSILLDVHRFLHQNDSQQDEL